MKCPQDSIHITGYTLATKAYKGSTQKLTCTLQPCGHEVDHMNSEIVEPRSVAGYGQNNSTTPGQTPEGQVVTPA